jgi:hypothetical protein
MQSSDKTPVDVKRKQHTQTTGNRDRAREYPVACRLNTAGATVGSGGTVTVDAPKRRRRDGAVAHGPRYLGVRGSERWRVRRPPPPVTPRLRRNEPRSRAGGKRPPQRKRGAGEGLPRLNRSPQERR